MMKNFAEALKKEKINCQKEYMELVKKLEDKMMMTQHDGFTGKCNGEPVFLFRGAGVFSRVAFGLPAPVSGDGYSSLCS
ncbi:hypothetical protein K2173_002403 [Erythroxylum novogranatense]|uniref:Uncharacterized protein n=1 Tax=Erythroxylum novogranatense TaxID=1862640 RepID=A0AAV8TB69_9ROSI|nr:hypothetical protein K2173_002403 [Erythroxylum novogranatense]